MSGGGGLVRVRSGGRTAVVTRSAARAAGLRGTRLTNRQAGRALARGR